MADTSLQIDNDMVGQTPSPLMGRDVTLAQGAVLSIGQPSSPSADLRLQGTGNSPMSVSLQQDGSIVLDNDTGVQFAIGGRLSPVPWTGGTPSLQVQTEPEPGTWALMAAGLTTLLFARRRQR